MYILIENVINILGNYIPIKTVQPLGYFFYQGTRVTCYI